MNNGNNNISPENDIARSMARLACCCQAGKRSVRMSMNAVPSTLLVRTEPERMSRVPGTIFNATSKRERTCNRRYEPDVCLSSNDNTTTRMCLSAMIRSASSGLPRCSNPFISVMWVASGER